MPVGELGHERIDRGARVGRDRQADPIDVGAGEAGVGDQLGPWAVDAPGGGRRDHPAAGDGRVERGGRAGPVGDDRGDLLAIAAGRECLLRPVTGPAGRSPADTPRGRRHHMVGVGRVDREAGAPGAGQRWAALSCTHVVPPFADRSMPTPR